MIRCARILSLASAVALLAACRRGPRRDEFPTFRAWQPFEGLEAKDVPSVAVGGEAPPTDAPAGAPPRAFVRVALPQGYVGVLPCNDGWQWARSSGAFMAIHRTGLDGRPLELVVAVEQSEPMGSASRNAAADAAQVMLGSMPADARAGLVTFGGDEDAVRPLGGSDARPALIDALRAARSVEGSRIAAGLRAADRLFSAREGVDRRIVVVASAQAGLDGAERAAESMAERGISVSVLALGRDARLASISTAGRGSFRAADDAPTLGALGACVANGRAASGPVDAWFVARALPSSDMGGSALLAQLRFLALVEPSLLGVDGLSDRAARIARALADPLGHVYAPGRGRADSAATLTGGGLGQRSDARDWTGWRWVGENRHRVRLRLGRVSGSFARAEEGASSMAEGTPTQLVLGFAGDGAHDEDGIGVAMLCTRAACRAAPTFAAMLAEIRAPDRTAPLLDARGDRFDELARAAGFRWRDAPAAAPSTSASASSSTPPATPKTDQR